MASSTTVPLLTRLIAAAVNVSQKSARILRDVKKSGEMNVQEKGINDFVTKADFLSQLNIIKSLEKQFPKLKFCGEEGDLKEDYPDLELSLNETVLKEGKTLPEVYQSIREEDLIVWVDPLDGTKEYTMDYNVANEVTVLIGVAWNGRPIAGVINQPFFKFQQESNSYLDRVLWGIVGLGGFDLTKGRISVTQNTANLPTIVTTRSHITDLIQKNLNLIPNKQIIHSDKIFSNEVNRMSNVRTIILLLYTFTNLLAMPNNNFLNVSSTLDKLLKNYDIRLRPKFGAETLNVSMEVVLASFDAISEVNMDYTITIYLNQYWNDERLVFGNRRDYLTLMGDFAEKIWLPDTFLANDKFSFLHDVTEKNKMIKIYGNGDVIYGMRFTTTLACMMDLHNYPLDSQNCTVEIESYGYTNKEVNICWKNSKASVKGVDKVSLPQFQILNYKTSTYLEQQATGYYTRLSLSFLLQRHIGYFIFQTYLPSTLIVMLSWVSFWINHEATSARVSLGITTVLTMTTISTGVRATLPRISYVKAIDIYLVTCFVFVFAALLEYAAVNYSYWSQRAKKRKKLNQAINQNISECYDENEVLPISSKKSKKKETSFIDDDYNRMSPLPWFYNSRNKNFNFEEDNNPHASFYAKSQDIRPDKSGSNSILNRKKPSANQRKLVKSIDAKSKKNKFLDQNGNYNQFANKRTVNRHLLSSFRFKAKGFKKILPQVKDISIIDKYSRIAFPNLFLLFNLIYWCFYVVQSSFYNT